MTIYHGLKCRRSQYTSRGRERGTAVAGIRVSRGRNTLCSIYAPRREGDRLPKPRGLQNTPEAASSKPQATLRQPRTGEKIPDRKLFFFLQVRFHKATSLLVTQRVGLF